MLFLNLNFNENAIELLKKNLDKIYWEWDICVAFVMLKRMIFIYLDCICENK